MFSSPRIWPLAPAAALVLLLAAACSDDDTNAPGPDAGLSDSTVTDPDGTTPPADKGVTPDTQKATSLKVAAVQYATGDYTSASGCSDDICGVAYFAKEAAKNGATLVVTPEYAQKQTTAELAPGVGDTPAKDSRWKDGGIIKSLSKVADEQNITLVFNLITQVGSGSSAKLYNTSLAVDKDGKVVGRHHKFQLFSSEGQQLTAGPDLKTSFFDTPAGKAGLMICADAQCLVTGLQTSPDCTSHSVSMLKDFYVAKKPKIILFSAFWTVGGSGSWAALNVQKRIATEGGGVWLVAANTTKGQGYGGGIWKPGGTALKTVQSSTPTVVYGEIPLP